MAKFKTPAISRLPFWFFQNGQTGAAIFLQNLLLRLSGKPERIRGLKFFRRGAALRGHDWQGEWNYGVYVINRCIDFKRIEKFARSCEQWGVDFDRVEAINLNGGHLDFKYYNRKIAETFYGKNRFLRGAVGCFLSHARCWKKLVDSNSQYALICEDDVRFLGSIPRRIEDFAFPTGTEIAFVNQRLGDFLEYKQAGKPFEYAGVFRAAEEILKNTGLLSAPGGEGYILSHCCAQKLLRIFEQKGVFMEVDWFLFFHSLAPQERSEFIRLDGTGRFDALQFPPDSLNSTVMIPALLEQINSNSTIGVGDPRNYTSRDGLFGNPENASNPSRSAKRIFWHWLGQVPSRLYHLGFTRIAIGLVYLTIKINSKSERVRFFFWLRQCIKMSKRGRKIVNKIPVYVINCDDHSDRLQKFSKNCKKWGVRFERVTGVDVHKKPDILNSHRDKIAERLYNSENFVKGIYGCFLGHVEAWKRVATCSGGWALICEDDAQFLGTLGGEIADFRFPTEAEIVFCNQRMGNGFLGARGNRSSDRGAFELFTAGEALGRLLDLESPISAPGGDGYFLSSKGAMKLLEIFANSQMAFDVDWFMLFQSVCDQSMKDFLERDTTGRFDGYIPHPNKLKGFVMIPSLVEQSTSESKVMRHRFCTREDLFK
jgi:GR25 family glycosyltransferase involved in LPS biosynthesis